VISKNSINTDFVSVKPGQAAGVKQIGRGTRKGVELITLEFLAAVDASESYDAIYISGNPNMEIVIKGGTHGDIATAAIAVNCAHRVTSAPPGLLTMKDLPIVSALGK
jgi:4-hydroxy-tetrahydrodipicolinate reductase